MPNEQLLLAEKKATRDGYGDGLVDVGKQNSNVVVLTADLSESTHSQLFEKAFPERFFEVGVAEQNLIGVAAGLALAGKVPFVSSYAVFSPGRNWDQFRVSVCYSQANVKVMGGHTGLMVGPDGATHQALEDIAITRVLPHVTVVVPADYWEARKATIALAGMIGPAYLRTTREASLQLSDEHTPFEIGRAWVMRPGKDVTLIGCGPILAEALKAAEQLAAQGIDAEVINCHTIKPLDQETLLNSVRKTGIVVTIEDHQVVGGLGGAVAELLSQQHPTPMAMVGVEDTFGESGSAGELWQKYGLSAQSIVEKIQHLLRQT